LVSLLVAAQVALFVWMAPRGFDVSDESYYFLQYLHWRELTATATFFGAIFDLPFRWMGHSIAGIRVLGLLLLLGSSGYFAFESLRRLANRNEAAPASQLLVFVPVAMSGAMLYYGYLSTLRAPSYNLLALTAAMLATGLLLRLTDGLNTARARWAQALIYGALMALCTLGKPTSGALLALIHAIFVLTLRTCWLKQHLGPLVFLSALGAGGVFGLLQLIHPSWTSVVRESLLIGAATDGRSLVVLARGLTWEVQRLPLELWGFVVVIIGLAMVLIRQVKPFRGAAATLTLALVMVCVVLISANWLTALWLPLVALSALVVFGLARADQTGGWSILLMLLAVPLALSFGTNMPMLAHSQINAVFAWTALLAALFALYSAGRVDVRTLSICLLVMTVPGLVPQVRAALEARHTYRQHTSLGEQNVSVLLGASSTRLLVDAEMAKSLSALSASALAAGWQPGQGMLDFTGDGPGWVFSLGGRPLGVPWLLGGYPGSDAAAALLVSRLPEAELRQSWLLSSDTTVRRIEGWPQSLVARLGAESHELVASVRIRAPYVWSKLQETEHVNLQLWRPKARP
jgi:hypothetical protein